MSQQGSQGQDAGNDGGGEITWVGEQRLMHGYCGRATRAVQATKPASPIGTEQGEAALAVRPVAALSSKARRRRQAVVRVGPMRPMPGAPATTIPPAAA